MQNGMRFLVPVVLALALATCSADSGDEGSGGSGGSTNTTRTGGSGAAAGRGGSTGGTSSSGSGGSSEGGSGGSEPGTGGSGGSGAATDGGAYAEAGSPPTKLNPANLETPPAITPPFSVIDSDGNVWWIELPPPAGF